MAKKIEIIGQSLVITDTDTSKVLFDAPKSEYYYKIKDLQEQSIINFYHRDEGDNAVDTPDNIVLSDAVDSGDTPFNESTFQTFARENLGFRSASGGSGAVGTLQQVTDQGAVTTVNSTFSGGANFLGGGNVFGANVNINAGVDTGSGNQFLLLNSVNKQNSSVGGLTYGFSNLIEHDGSNQHSQLRGIFNRTRIDGSATADEILTQYNELSYRQGGGATAGLVSAFDNYVRVEPTASGTINFPVGMRSQMILNSPNVTYGNTFGLISKLVLDQGTLPQYWGVEIDINQAAGTTLTSGAFLRIGTGIDEAQARANDFYAIDSPNDIKSLFGGEIEAKQFTTTGGTQKDVVKGDGSLEHRADVAGTGWQYITDSTYTSASPLVIPQGNTSDLALDGSTNITSQLPLGVTSFYDLLNGIITPENIGDGMTFTLGFKARNNNVNGVATFAIDIGGSVGLIFPKVFLFPKGANQENDYYFTLQGYTLDTFVANGGQIVITSNVGQTELYDPVLQLHRTHKAR